MFIFYGIRKTKIKNKVLQGKPCPYCNNNNSLILTVHSRYFHVFWVPFFPLSKSNSLDCTNCKKTFSEVQLPADLRNAIKHDNTINRPKRPLWLGCGCLTIISLVVLLSITGTIGYFKNRNSIDKELDDVRREYLKQDMKKSTSHPNEKTDSISFFLKDCVSLSIDGINMDEIKYYTRINNDKILILLEVRDFKEVHKSSRKELVYAIEECLESFEFENIKDVYIGIDGRWNMLMVKTPFKSDLDGDYADESWLLPFYDNDTIHVDQIK